MEVDFEALLVVHQASEQINQCAVEVKVYLSPGKLRKFKSSCDQPSM